MANQIVISSGAKVRNLNGVLTGTTGVVNSLGINVANGIPQLDGSGKILVSQLPNSVMEYKGTWNAATNTPTLVNGTGNQGDVYLCNVAGTTNFGAGAITFAVGDQVIYSGTIWQKAGGSTGTVTSVAVTETGDALTITGSPITTSGTINIGFAGTSGQYVNGAGGLTTFPSLTGYVPYTGATNDLNLGTKNLYANNAFLGFSSITASGTQVVLTVASVPTYIVTGSGGQTIKLPDATTLPNGANYVFNNNQSSGAILVNNNSNTLVVSIPSGGYCTLELTDNSIAAGSWDRHFEAPSNVSWSTNTLDYAGSITNATWNGNVIQPNRGGTGQSTYTDGQLLIGNSTGNTLSKSTLTSGTGIAITNGGGSISIASTITQYTDALARASLSFAAGSGAYNSTTGVITIPTNNNQITNGAGYITSADLSGYVPYTGATTDIFLGAYGLTARGLSSGGIGLSQSTSSSGTGATYINGTSTGLRINPNASSFNNFAFPASATNTYTYPNATGTIALTSDIPSLSGYIQGSGTTSYVPKFTASGTIGNSIIYDTGSRIAIGGTSATYGVLTVQSDAGQFCIQSNTTPGKQLQIGYDHTTNNSYLSSLNQGVAFTPLALQPNGGNVGIGTSSPANLLGLQSPSANTRVLNIYNGLSGGGDYVSIGSQYATNNANVNSEIRFGNELPNNAPSYLAFATGTGSTPTERMRITSGGNVAMSGGLTIGNITSQGSVVYFSGGVVSAGAGVFPLKWNNSSGIVTYDTSTRLVKDNIVDNPYGLKEVLQLKPRKYYRIDDEREEIGFVADEVVNIIPELVPLVKKSLFTKNQEDEELIAGGVYYEKLTSVLVKAIQEQQAQIEELKAKIK